MKQKIKDTFIKKTYDVIVIGGGPSGMMAAISACSVGKKVLLLEKNDHLGKKLLITGGGRCNMTNSEFDLRKFLANYKDSDKFLFSAFTQYGVKETLDFFHDRGMQTKVENEGRTFPVSDSARSVYNVLVNEMEKTGVEVLYKVKVIGFDVAIKGIKNNEKKENYKTHIDSINIEINGINHPLKAKKYILATGGTSHPETGSTGDAYPWLQDIGHTVIIPKPVLVPVVVKDKWVKDMQGISLSDVKMTVFADNQKIVSKKGRILCTHFGITGPTVLNTSRKIHDLIEDKKKVSIHIDLLPTYDHGALNSKLQEIFSLNKSKMIKNTLLEIIPESIVQTILSKANIRENVVCSQITREERMILIDNIKNITMNVTGLLGEDKAIIASGGVPLTEIDFKTCGSRICDNLSIIGDLLDIDRPSGGYSLQLCWTTGYVAGKN